MKINDVNQGIQKYRPTKRLGRGIGSGQGKTAGRGHKGEYARSGGKRSLVFQGGTMPLFRRLPKRGFHNKFAWQVGEVNLRDLELAYQSGDEVNPENLRAHDLAKYRYDVLKVLGTGELTKPLTVHAHRFSAAAKEKIEKAGGTVVILPMPQPVVKNQKKAPRSPSQ